MVSWDGHFFLVARARARAGAWFGDQFCWVLSCHLTACMSRLRFLKLGVKVGRGKEGRGFECVFLAML